MSAVGEIDRLIRERHLLKHPFYAAWSRGEISRETLRDYAGQYYHFESNFPRFVGATYAHLTDPAARRTLLANLIDEEGRDPTHPELWIDFGRGLGLTRRAIRDARPHPATRNLLATYERQTLHGSLASGLGALYAYESIFPEIAAEKSRGLREHYGIRSASAHEFFRVHATADIEHSGAERRLLARELGRSGRAVRDARAGARSSVDAWWKFLDAFPAD
ncbi:MAG TPA: CADD family putative folate metabolism protein [Thermoplasmata archaeon]|nr:CADD family putative folate metabolism protein [Thermoplasmata archaeon]HUI38314.1 CADD family putative folate metabolism protein [Thermoplasmata archaeon]